MIIKIRIIPKVITCFSNSYIRIYDLELFPAGVFVVEHKHVRNFAYRKNRTICLCKSPEFTDSPKKGKHTLIHFHPGKCKKYYFVFKNKCLKKLLVLIVFKSFDYQWVFYALAYKCFSYAVKQYKLHLS